MKNLFFLTLFCVVIIAVAATGGLVPENNSQQDTPEGNESASPAQPYIDQGKFYLVSHNILSARNQFKLAVQADAASQEANLLYGVTRVLAVAEDSQTVPTNGIDTVREIFESSGFVFSQYSVYGSTYTSPHQLAAGTPRTGAVLNFLNANLLPEVNGAIANLNTITNTSFSSVIDPSSINKGPGVAITVDYADAVVIKSLLQLLKCNLELLMVYGLDVSVPDIQGAPSQLMTYKQFFQDATFLAPKDASRLTTAKSALISFIDNYNVAAQYLINRSSSGHHLFVVDIPITDEAAQLDSLKLDKIRKDLAKLKTGLNGTYLLPNKRMKDQDRLVDLSKFFNSASPINFRSKIAECGSGIVLPDPTVGGLFPLGLSASSSPKKPGYAGDILGVSCTGRETPLIHLKPGTIHLGYSYPDLTGPQSVTVSNHGTKELSISSIALIGQNNSDFTLAAGTCGSTFPLILQPGSSCTAQVDLNTPPYSIVRADLEVDSNDVNAPRSFVELSGTTTSTNSSPTPTGSYSLSISFSGSGSGSVEYSGLNSSTGYQLTTCPGICSGSYETSSYMTLKPKAASGSIFAGWSGCDSVEGDKCYVRMYAVKNVTATFNTNSLPLSVIAYPPGGTYTSPQTITLTANREASIYYTLNGSTPTSSSIKYNGPFSLTAPTTTLRFIAIDSSGSSSIKTETYSWVQNPFLTVNTTGSGGGVINSVFPNSGLIVCSRPAQLGDFCSVQLQSGTIVTLSASHDSVSTFDSWSLGTCPGNGNCTIILNTDTTVTGTFTALPSIRVETSGYPTTYHTTIQDAFAHAYANSVIRLQAIPIYNLNPSYSLPFLITIHGGYNADFITQTDYSYLQGIFSVNSGSVIIDRVIIK